MSDTSLKRTQKTDAGYRLWVNPDSTILVRVWDEGFAEIAYRADRSHTWGPPRALYEEAVR